MQCKELQTKIAVHDALTPEEQRHTETCAECATFAAFDRQMEMRLEDWRVPTEAFRRRTTVRPYRFAYAGMGLAAVLTLAIVALPSRSGAQEAYRKMMGRVRAVKTVHLTVRWQPDGKGVDAPLKKTYELWWKPGAWREQWEKMRPSLKLKDADGLTFYRYDPRTNQVGSSREVGHQEDFQTFDLVKFADQYMATPTKFEQPTPTKLIATNAGGWSRMIFTLDAASGLPTHATKLYLDGTVWRISGEIDLELNVPIADEEFKPEGLKEEAKP